MTYCRCFALESAGFLTCKRRDSFKQRTRAPCGARWGLSQNVQSCGGKTHVGECDHALVSTADFIWRSLSCLQALPPPLFNNGVPRKTSSCWQTSKHRVTRAESAQSQAWDGAQPLNPSPRLPPLESASSFCGALVEKVFLIVINL